MEGGSLFVMLHMLAVHLSYKLLGKSYTMRFYSMDEIKERAA